MSLGVSAGPVILCILDGWGHRLETADNAVWAASTPVMDHYWAQAPRGLLAASGPAVGLPEGQMGNSEVGHTHLGAGRVVWQDYPLIDRALEDGTLARHPLLLNLAARLKAAGKRLHLMGLLSPGGVHAHERHMMALAQIMTALGVEVVFHAFLDGRDTPPRSASSSLALWARGPAEIASVSGRFYAMDRDQRAERTAKALAAIACAQGPRYETASEALAAAYAQGQDDEFVPPCVLGSYAGLAAGDGVLIANFRADRVRQLLSGILALDPAPEAILGLTSYGANFTDVAALFPMRSLEKSLGAVVSAAGGRQLRAAESEKFAHVTYFFNGGCEQPFPGEQRIVIPSPKVQTYDQAPAMSAAELTTAVITELERAPPQLTVLNYANGDMVGHSGDFAATTEAISVVDRCLGRLMAAALPLGARMIITADHGNAETMRDPVTGLRHTAHTCNPVPLLMVDGMEKPPQTQVQGRLADIAPTILALLGLDRPQEMEGQNLFPRH